jgi:hypothetical protein
MGDTVSDMVGDKPKVDKEATDAAKREKARLAAEKREQEKLDEAEQEAKRRGLRGRKALGGGPLTGFGDATLMS